MRPTVRPHQATSVTSSVFCMAKHSRHGELMTKSARVKLDRASTQVSS